jgi:hypothetical protein
LGWRTYKTQYQNGFEQISVQLKRRLDLIGNLVDAVGISAISKDLPIGFGCANIRQLIKRL